MHLAPLIPPLPRSYVVFLPVLTIRGVLSMPVDDTFRAVELIESRRHPIEKLHTHSFPIEQVRTTADQILRTGEAQYPVIGAQVRTGGAESVGALITEVNKDTPAEDAGLLKDDVVIAVDGKPVTDGIALIVAIRTHQPGETIEFTVMRDGSEKAFKITLGGEVG